MIQSFQDYMAAKVMETQERNFAEACKDGLIGLAQARQYGIYRVDFLDGSHAIVEAHTAERAQGTAAGICGKRGTATWLRDPTEEEQDGPGQVARYFPAPAAAKGQ